MPLAPLLRRLMISGIALLATTANAQPFPSKPIGMVLGFSAGGSTDAVARLYAQRIGDILKTSIVVENKPGAGQVLAIKTVQAAPADGYTLYFGSASALSQGPGVRNDLPYDPLKDLTLIGLVAKAPGVIVVSPKLAASSFKELVDYSRQHPNELNYGSSGVGSASHLQSEYLIKMTGLKMTHIPFKADADIFREIFSGSVHVGMAPAQGALAAVAAGRVRPLAVTGAARLKALPDVPSLAELGIKGVEGIDPYTYYGLAGPVGLPASIVKQLNEAINRASASPDVVAQMRDRQFAEPATGTPESFRRFIEDDTRKWREFGKVVKLTQ